MDEFNWDACWCCGSQPEVVMAGFGLPSSPEIVTTFFCRPCANTTLRDDLVRGYLRKVRERVEVYELDGRPFDHHDLPPRIWEPDDEAYREYLSARPVPVMPLRYGTQVSHVPADRYVAGVLALIVVVLYVWIARVLAP